MPVSNHGQHVLDEMVGCLGHAFGAARRAETAFLAREGDDLFFLTTRAGKSYHGKNFNNGTYAYAILPDMTVEQWNAIAMEPPFAIRANTPNVQGVWHNTLNMGMAVFYEAGSIRLKDDLEITTDTPIMLLWRESGDSIRLSLASPLYKSGQVALRVSRMLEGEGVRHEGQQGSSSLHITLPSGESAGSSVVLNVKGASL